MGRNDSDSVEHWWIVPIDNDCEICCLEQCRTQALLVGNAGGLVLSL